MSGDNCMVLVGLALAMTAVVGNADPVTLKLWPDRAPGVDTNAPAETVLPDKGDGVIRITNVSEPTLTVYRPETPNGTAVLVCPGGGYSILAFNHEGTDVCEWLTRNGVTGCLLKYRVPKQREGALQDAQRAMRVIRQHAEEWGIQRGHVGVLGFSAGGHLAASLSTRYRESAYAPIDDADTFGTRPDFSVLIYPAYLLKTNKAGSTELALPVTRETPPAFLVQAENDHILPENSIAYFLALKAAGVQAELHLYPEGGHGFGMKPVPYPIHHWTLRCEEWMRARGLIPATE